MDKYLQSSTCYDEQLPFFSSIVRLVMQTQYLEYLQQSRDASHASVPLDEKSEEQPKEEEKAQPEPTKIVGKSNPFKSVLTTQQIKLLVECINEAHIFTTTITPKILSDFFACKLNGVLKSNNNRLLAYLMMQLSCYNYIAYEWQSRHSQQQAGTCQDKRQIPHTQRLVERDRQREVHLPERIRNHRQIHQATAKRVEHSLSGQTKLN